MLIGMDTETRGAANLSMVGADNYADGAEVILLSYKLGDEQTQVVDLAQREKIPEILIEAVQNQDNKIVFHNAFFDVTVINRTNLFGFPLRHNQIIDTMAIAASLSLPTSLEALGIVFGLGEDNGKMSVGKSLINLFSIPKLDMASGTMRYTKPSESPEEWKVFKEYATRDVDAMMTLYKLMPKIMPIKEYDVWVLDQEINSRGFLVDMAMCELAKTAAEDAQSELEQRTSELTNGELSSCRQVAALRGFLNGKYGIVMEDASKDTVDKMLTSNLPSEARELLEIRREVSQSTASKYSAAQTRASAKDHRARGTLQYCGASRTGRWAGRGIQPHNFKRPTCSEEEGDAAIDALFRGDFADKYSGRRIDMLGNIVRGTIKAPDGKKLVAADLSNIEGRTLVWLSEEEWKLDFFRKFDAGEYDYDNYVKAYHEAMNCSWEEAKKNRKVGKVMELGLGYASGVGGFVQFAAVYGLNLTELADAVKETQDANEYAECFKKYEWAKKNGYDCGLGQHEYAACELLKTKWRNAHPKTVRFWAALEEAFRNAVLHANTNFNVGKLCFRRTNQWLRVRLPSGRNMVYPNAGIDKNGECFYFGDVNRKWVKKKTYSGRLAENVTSAVARDVLAYNMPLIEMNGYDIVLTVHDEVVCETPDTSEYSAEELSSLLASPHNWSEGLPLAAAGYESYRYKKG